jgi:hypothetical protein
MRELLEFLEAHPNVPTPEFLYWTAMVSVGDPSDGAALVEEAAATMGVECVNVGDGAYTMRMFGPIHFSVEYPVSPSVRASVAARMAEDQEGPYA